MKFNFTPLANLEALSKDAVCGTGFYFHDHTAYSTLLIDVIVIVKDVGEMGEITSKATQRAIPKRDIVVADDSGYSCRLTLWGKQAENFNAPDQPVVAFKGVKVNDFGGRSTQMSRF